MSERERVATRVGLYSIRGETGSGPLGRFLATLRQSLEQAGISDEGGNATDASLVLNVVDAAAPKPFRRRSKGTFVAAVYERDADPTLESEYPMLVRALANIVLCVVPGRGVWFTTMERGFYHVEDRGDEEALAADVVERLLPIASARLVIDNEFRADLEPDLWDGDEVTEEIHEAGERLGRLDLLPNPFPIEDLLSERELRHVKRLYGIGGLSYGNLSQRKDETRFWMSASGVDKSKLETPGRDILLVSGYDQEHARIILSVPPGIEPRRVSVDAIEHWMIYTQHPDVGAILHVHAWVEGIAATDINYPCGSEELARSVSELVNAAPDPTKAIVGLRNHGITATGTGLTEILDRIEPKVLRQVPMY
jgi:ribulose-5-phosphate 4-epimerase/fuculose-1-phosphate aldolase